MSLQDRVFGQSIFGDAVHVPASAEKPTFLTPAWGKIPVTAAIHPRIPVDTRMPATLPIPAHAIPAGTAYVVGGKVAVVEQNHPVVPVTTVVHGRTPIPEHELEVYNGSGYRGKQHRYRTYPGVFHRPPYAGAYRYEVPHSFGPPNISGFGQWTTPPPATGLFCPPGYRVTGNTRRPCVKQWTQPKLSGMGYPLVSQGGMGYPLVSQGAYPPVVYNGYGAYAYRAGPHPGAIPTYAASHGYGASPDGLGAYAYRAGPHPGAIPTYAAYHGFGSTDGLIGMG